MAQLYVSPFYKQQKDNWIKWRDLFLGDHDVLSQSQYLWAHNIEKKTDPDAALLRRGREERTRYLNLCDILISLLVSWFFRKPPNTSKVEKLLGDRLTNIDGTGQSFKTFLREELAETYLTYGKATVLCENTAYKAHNRAVERGLGILPTLSIIQPLDLVDWDIEYANPKRLGAFNMLRREFTLLEPRQRSKDTPKFYKYSHEYCLESGKVQIYRYRVLLDENGNIDKRFLDQKNEITWEELSVEPLDMPDIPANFIESQSWIKDAAEECLRAYNIRSNKDNILYMQGYRSDYITGVDPTNSDLRKAFGEYVKVILPDGAGVIFTPPVDTTQYDAAYQDAINTTFKVGLNLYRTLPADSKVAQSADSMNEAKDNPLALIESTIEDLENATNGALKHFAAFAGRELGPDEKVEFYKEVSEESWDRFIQLVQGLGDYFANVDVVNKAIAKKGVKLLGFDDELTQLANDAIDKTQIKSTAQGIVQPDRNNLLRQALNGKGQGTPQPAAQG